MSVMTPSASDRARPAARRPATSPGAAALSAPVGEETARVLAVVGLAAIAVIHILDAPGTFDETRYIFWLYMAIVIGAIPVSILLLDWRSRLAWIGPALIAAGPLLGYVLTRTVGLPGDSGDIGNWVDSLGIASLFVETSVLVLSLVRLGAGRSLLARLRGQSRLT